MLWIVHGLLNGTQILKESFLIMFSLPFPLIFPFLGYYKKLRCLYSKYIFSKPQIKIILYYHRVRMYSSPHTTKHFRKGTSTAIPNQTSFPFSLDFVSRLGAQASHITTKRQALVCILGICN